MLLMLIVLQNRGDNEIMRAAKAALSIIVASSSSCCVVVRAQGNRSRGGRNTLHGYTVYMGLLRWRQRIRAQLRVIPHGCQSCFCSLYPR